MTADDYALSIHHNGLAESKFLNRCRHGIHGGIVLPGVVLVWGNLGQLPLLNFHGQFTP
jgi:hypothetical protein